MPLTNMKMSKKEVKGDCCGEIASEQPRYPWGLGINLDEESITKLGITELPTVGDPKMIVAYVDVTETREEDSVGGKKRRNIRLQITDMSLEKKVKPNKLKTLYGDESKK